MIVLKIPAIVDSMEASLTARGGKFIFKQGKRFAKWRGNGKLLASRYFAGDHRKSERRRYCIRELNNELEG